MASYEEEGHSISFDPLATTRMACADDVITAERAYLAALESVSSWSATNAELVLPDAAGDELLRYTASGAVDHRSRVPASLVSL